MLLAAINNGNRPKLDRIRKDIITLRSSHPQVFLGKGVLKICSKFRGEHPC